MFTIGVPSFLLAQIPSEGLIKGNFMLNVIFNAVPAALTNLVLIAVAAFIGTEFLQIPRPILSTVCTFIWAVVGLIYLVRLCRPFDRYKSGIVFLCVVGMILFSIFLKDLYGVELKLTIEGWGIFLTASALALPVMFGAEKCFKWFTDKFYDKYIQRIIAKLPSFAQMIERRKKRFKKY